MGVAMLMCFACTLLIVAKEYTVAHAYDSLPELTYDEFYRHWLNKQLGRYGKNASIFSRTGTQILPNYTIIDSLDINVVRKRGSLILQLNDVLINGFSNIVVDELTAEIYYGKENAHRRDTLYELDVSIPTLELNATYRSNGTWVDENLDCTGNVHVLFEKVSARAGVYLQQAVGPNRVDFLKVKIKKNSLTGYWNDPIKVTNCSAVVLRDAHRASLLASIGTELKPLLINRFQEKIRDSLNYVFSWDSYYAVLFGKVLQ